MHGLRGKLGNLVFSMRNGKQIVGLRPTRTKPLSVAQKEVNKKFKRAAAYASEVLRNPATQALYTQKIAPDRTPYNIAMADYFNVPEIDALITEKYTGLPGSVLTILAEDDFKVQSVHVRIVSGTGNLVEEGEAALDAFSKRWIYIAAQTNTALPGTSIVVAAYDMPGNKRQLQIILP